MSVKLEKLLNQLSDNVWHNVDEIANALGIPESRFQQIISLLTETDMVQHNAATNQIRLNQNWKTLYINQKETNPEPKNHTEPTTVGTIVIPPQKTLIIQCTRITNLTDVALELEVRVNKKLNEIAISKLR